MWYSYRLRESQSWKLDCVQSLSISFIAHLWSFYDFLCMDTFSICVSRYSEAGKTKQQADILEVKCLLFGFKMCWSSRKKCQDPNCQAVKSSSLGQLKQSQDISSTNYMIWHMIHICNMLYIYIYMNILYIYMNIYIYIHMINACLISDFIFCPSHGMMFRSRPRSAKLGAASAKRRSGALRNRIVAKRQRCLKSFSQKKTSKVLVFISQF